MLSLIHAVIDFGVKEMHRKSLITDNSLIVTLSISNNLLLPSSVGQGVNKMAHVPIFVRDFLEGLDPHVGQEHTESIIEADTTISNSSAESWEARDVLSDGDSSWTNFVDKGVGKHEVDNTIEVSLETEVLVISTGEAIVDTVMMVENGGDSIESETINLVLIKEPSEVGEQESLDLILGVVEEHGVPTRVVSSVTSVREAVIGSIEFVDTVNDVVGSVGMDQIDDDLEAHAVCLVDEEFEIIWSS